MKKHFSIPANQQIFRNFSKANGFSFTITVPFELYKEVNGILKKYNAKIGYDYDNFSYRAFGFWFDAEEYYTFFTLKYS
jgi:hypothetical protein